MHPSSTGQPAPPPSYPSPACAVLVVDDDETIRTAVGAILDEEGYRVATAADGAVALQHVTAAVQPPDVVLLDMRMPRLDGWGFARAVRERGLTLPLVVMTAARHAQQWCAEVGGVACLEKPFDLSEVLQTVARVCAEQGREPPSRHHELRQP